MTLLERKSSSESVSLVNPLMDVVRVGWDDRSLAEGFRQGLASSPDPEMAQQAYQVARRVILRDRTDEEGSALIETLLEVLERSGWSTETQMIASRVAGVSGASPRLRRQAARILLDGGAIRPALSLVSESVLPEDQVLAARCHAALGDHERALEIAMAAIQCLPEGVGEPSIVTLLARSAIAAGRPEAALASLRRVPKENRDREFLLLDAGVREKSGDIKGAARSIRMLLDREPEDQEARDSLVLLLSQAGQAEMARSAFDDGLSLAATKLPETVDALFDEPSRFISVREVPEGRARWLSGAIGEELDLRQLREFLAFDRALLAWAQVHPERIHELTGRVRLSDATQGMMIDMHLHGRGALVASAHAGLIGSAPLALLASGVRFCLASPAEMFDLPGLSDRLVPVVGRPRTAALRDLLRHLRSGEVVTLSADEVSAGRTQVARVFGMGIPVSDLCARLSERFDVPTVFPRVLPTQEGEIAVDLRPLPSPSASCSGKAFREAWVEAWASELEDFLRAAPWAMRGRGGFWSALPAE